MTELVDCMIGLPGSSRQIDNLPGIVALLSAVLQLKKYATPVVLLAREIDQFIAVAVGTVLPGTNFPSIVDDLWQGVRLTQAGFNQQAIAFFGTI